MIAGERGTTAVALGLPDYLALRLPTFERALAADVESLVDPCGVKTPLARGLGVEGSRGRRWRPVFTLLAAEAVGGETDAVMGVAIAVELTHTASLVLDDLPCMDDASERRGEPAMHRLVGPAGAILLAVGCLARAAELLGSSGPAGGELAAEWGDAFGLAGMAGGQAVDLAERRRLTGSLRRLHRRKTTALASFALSAGARAAGADAVTRRELAAFGRDVGWAYQLADDAHDRSEDEAQGRPPGGRAPRRQSGRLLARASRRLRRSAVVEARWAGLLVGLAEEVVGHHAQPGTTERTTQHLPLEAHDG